MPPCVGRRTPGAAQKRRMGYFPPLKIFDFVGAPLKSNSLRRRFTPQAGLWGPRGSNPASNNIAKKTRQSVSFSLMVAEAGFEPTTFGL